MGYVRVCFTLSFALLVLVQAGTVRDIDAAASQEVLKLMSIKLNALTSRHSLEMNSVKKDIELLRQEMRSLILTKSENSSGLDMTPSLEWAHESMDSLRAELAVLRGEMSDVRVELAAARAEANSTAVAAAGVAAGGAAEDRLAGALRDIEAAKMETEKSNKVIENLKKQIRVVELELRMSFKSFNKLSKNWAKSRIFSEEKINDPYSHKFRHLRLLRKQMQELKKSHWKLNSMHDNMTDQIIHLQAKLESMAGENSVYDVNTKVEELERNQMLQKRLIQNITADVGNFNKLHTSMLELLENMENLEEKVDSTLPDFQKEISKLEVDMAQLNSHHDYIKNNQESIRQSVKAIAVSVSNMVDKVDADHLLLEKHNKSLHHLEHQSKLHFYRLADHISKTEASQAQNGTMLDADDMPELMGELKEYQDIIHHLPENCEAIKEFTGKALIAPGPGAFVQTYCDDGWTLVQSRYNGSVDFNQKYKEYVDGFGSPDGEFWIGNEALHRLTRDNCSSLRIQMQDIYGNFWEANYLDFRVGSASTGYRLFVDGFSGNASDALNYQNNMEFSTIDRDRDISNTNCAADYEGGWWFSHCQHANLNGKYILGLTWFDAEHNEWIAIATSRITLRDRPECSND